MAKEKKKGKKKKKDSGPRDAVRGAVESTFQRASGGVGLAQELLDDVAKTLKTLRDANLVETLESVRSEVQSLAQRVASLEIRQTEAPAPAATRRPAVRRTSSSPSAGARKPAARKTSSSSTAKKPAASRSTGARKTAASSTAKKPAASRSTGARKSTSTSTRSTTARKPAAKKPAAKKPASS